jgi:hypothetical protein
VKLLSDVQSPWWVLPTLAITVLLIFVAVGTYALLLGDSNLRLIVVTSAGNFTSMVLAYYFGSSAGSAKKDDIIAAASPPPKV